jgi:hypothetical protein
VPLLAALALIVLALLLALALIPLALIQRFRVGTARRQARGWIASINLFGLALSLIMFVTGAAIMNVWVPDTLAYTGLGLGAGVVLGLLGLALTRWERSPLGLHYTPNKWLVLGITLVVTMRVLYGFWRGWETWRAGLGGESLLITAGVAASLGAGAVVIGYYLTFWIGVRRRFHRAIGPRVRRRA